MKFGLTQDRLFHEVLEEITYAEELGFESVWLPEHAKVMRSMELFARHVMPEVREAAAQRGLAATH